MRSLLQTLPVLLVVIATSAHASVDVPESAYAEGAFSGDDARAETRLLADASQARPGDTIRVGVLFSLDPGWHVYWRNPGQSGLATELTWEGDLAVGPLQWPAPEVISTSRGFIITYGYSDEVLLFASATVPETADGVPSIDLNVTADYLVCAATCIPGRVTMARQIALGEVSQPAAPEVVGLFDAATERLPRPAETLGLDVETVISQSAVRPGDEFRIAVAAVACAGPPEEGTSCPVFGVPDELAFAFAPHAIEGIDLEVSASRPHPGAYAGQVIELTGRASPDDPGEHQVLTGVLFLTSVQEDRTLAVAVEALIPRTRPDQPVESIESLLLAEVPAAATADDQGTAPLAPVSPAAPPFSITLWQALLLGLLGGLILNVMPCVFPVLGIKVLALTNMGQMPRRHVAAHTGAYTFGILTTMWILAATVTGLRATGVLVGQGSQFQQPLFIAGISAVLVIFGLNLFGVFHIGSPGDAGLGKVLSKAQGFRRSIGEGQLAVLLATPCSAPFLTPAAGFAFAAETEAVFLVFSAIGIGLASPFVVLSIIPGWTRLLPKPGRWMERVKQVFGFFQLGVVVWLVWIMGHLAGTDGMTKLLAFLVAVGLGTWAYGALQQAGGRRLAGLALAGLIVCGTGYVALRFEYVDSEGATESMAGPYTWQAWDRQAIALELERGRPVFVDFTAAWCTTCKANEHLVLETQGVIDAVATYNVAMFVADWTRPDREIYAALQEFGRAGVPLYLVYSPLQPETPRVLPELLTVDTVVGALREAAIEVADASSNQASNNLDSEDLSP